MLHRMGLNQKEVLSDIKGYVNKSSISASVIVSDAANKQVKTCPKMTTRSQVCTATQLEF